MKKRIAALLVLLCGGFVALLLLVVLPSAQRTAPGSTSGSGTPTVSAPVLTDMQRIEDLQTRFNRDAGAPRLILLLSPT
jgi:hypothetical protein